MTLREYIDSGAATTQQVAEKLGVNPSTVYRWMSGDTRPSVDDALALARETYGRVPVESWASSEKTTEAA